MPVVLARLVMFEFVFIVEAYLLLQVVGPRRGRRWQYTQTTLQCQALFYKKVSRRFFRRPRGAILGV